MINTETFILDWVFTIYTRTFSIKAARVLWDMFLVFGEYYLLRVAYAIFKLLRKDLVVKKNIEDGLKFIRSRTNTLKLSEIVKLSLRENKSHGDYLKIKLNLRSAKTNH